MQCQAGCGLHVTRHYNAQKTITGSDADSETQGHLCDYGGAIAPGYIAGDRWHKLVALSEAEENRYGITMYKG